MDKLRPALTAADWCRLNQLLEQALALEGEARASWLETLPDDGAGLRGVLRELLTGTAARDGTDRDLVRVPTAVASVAADALIAMRHERPGDRIGPWRLERLLAEGGMGAVWVAQRADGVMQRTAALKLPRAEWADGGLTERIARERAILARLQHPCIAVLYDAGVASNGRPFLALEYVDGAPIDEHCRGRDLRAVLRLFVQVARAVAYAHAQLVIHRDLKPANVLVTKDGLPKLLDFGISKLIAGEAPLADETALTRLAGRRLTLAYAAPEQVLGQPISVAADVYALGVMLFELLAGRLPYRARDPRALEAEILRGEPPRPSTEATDAARARALRGELDAIVLTALRRDPAARYQTAAALADDIERYLAGLPVAAQPDRSLYRLRKFVTRNALPVAAGAAVIVALGAGLGIALWQAQRAMALNDFVLSLIRQADPNASQQTRAADQAMLGAIESRIDQDFRGSAEQLLQLRLTVAEAYFNRGEMTAAQRVFQRAADEAAAHMPADNLLLLRARVRASDDKLVVSGAAAALLESAIDILRRSARRGGQAAELLIDALLIQQDLRNEYGVPEFLPADRRLDSLREANEVALEHFGAGSAPHLRVAGPYAQWRWRIESRESARRHLEAVLSAARARGDDGKERGLDYLMAEGRLAAISCEHGVNVAASAATLRGLIERVRVEQGATSWHLEELLSLSGSCASSGPNPARSPYVEAHDVAVARERPPSTNVMRRAQRAYEAVLAARDYAAAETFYRSTMLNAAAIEDPALRMRLTSRLRILHVCQLAYRGDADGAVHAAEPLIAEADDVFRRLNRMTPGQGELWTCLNMALRDQGRYEEATRTVATFMERCLKMTFSLDIRLACEGNALIERAFVEIGTGRLAAAEATMAQRLALSPDLDRHAAANLAHGVALLGNGKADEALAPLTRHHATWLSLQPDSPHTAEALYWLGRAHAQRDPARGKAMIATARPLLANSPVQSHRRLAANALD